VTAGLAIGGASGEGVRHVPWQEQKPTAVAHQKAAGSSTAGTRRPLIAADFTCHACEVSATHGHAAKTDKVKPTKGKMSTRTAT
jgi:hypothetical protein